MADPPNDARLDLLVRFVASIGAIGLVVVLAVATGVLVDGSLPATEALGSGPDSDLLSPVIGSLLTAGLALVVSVPLALATALYVSEYAPNAVAKRAATLLDIMSAIPTLVFGMWGLVVFEPLLGSMSMDSRGVGVIVSERGGALLAGLVLAVMLLPYLSSMTLRMIVAVPTSLREAAAAVGANRWEIIRFVVLPHVSWGLLGATLLGLSRAAGEAMAVVFLIGSRAPAGGQGASATMATRLLRFGPDAHASELPLLALLACGLLSVGLLVHWIGRVLVRRSASGWMP